jgi:hypothetical protein
MVEIKDPSAVHIEPARVNNPDHENLREATSAWISENRGVYSLFLKFAQEMASKGRCFGVKMLAERVRWECLVLLNGDYKINNNYVAYIARRLVMEDPSLGRYIRFRKTQW